MKSTDWKIFVAFEGGQRLPLTSDFDKLMHVVSSGITINIGFFKRGINFLVERIIPKGGEEGGITNETGGHKTTAN